MKKIIPTILAALISLPLVAGCSIFGEPIAEKVAKAIDRYCEEPYQQRHVYRHSINSQLAAEGHSIVVTCSGDPEPHDE